jgi:hypothetical protein
MMSADLDRRVFTDRSLGAAEASDISAERLRLAAVTVRAAMELDGCELLAAVNAHSDRPVGPEDLAAAAGEVDGFAQRESDIAGSLHAATEAVQQSGLPS